MAELDDELQVYRNSDQRLSELMVGRLAGYGSHLRFDEIKVAVVEKVLSLMESTEQWLEGIQKGLLTVSSARGRMQ